MRSFLHAWWPVAVVVIFTATLVLQIPRKALFFQPKDFSQTETFVSFVSLDDETYAQLVQRIRMAWQIRGRPHAGGIADSRTDAFDFSSLLPPPDYLPLRALETSVPVPPAATPPPPALLPPSLGREPPPIPSAVILPDRDPGLLTLSDGLPDVYPRADFSLKKPRSIK